MQKMIEFAKLISNLAVSFINISTTEIDEGIDNALEKIGEYAQADRSYLFLYSDDKTRMNNVYEWVAKGVSSEMDNLQNHPVDTYSWFNAKVLAGETVAVSSLKDLPKEAKNEKEEWEREGIQSLVCLPLNIQGSIGGFIGFDSVKEEIKWQEDTLTLLQIAGEMIANALSRQEAEAAQRNKLEELSVLHSLSMVMTDANSLEELLKGALTILWDTFSRNIHSIEIKNEDSNLMDSMYMDSNGKLVMEAFEFGIGLTYRVMKTGKPARVNDVSKDPDYVEFFMGTQSEMIVPLISGGKVVGTVNLESKDLNAFTQRDQDLIEIFSRQLGIVIEKLSLFEQVKELATQDSLTGMFNRRHFFELAEPRFAEAKRYEHPLSAIMLDLDGFKEVNDVHGHSLGDQVLMALGEIFEVGLRSSDVAGRYGGDEFVVLLPKSDLEAVKILAGRLDQIAKGLITTNTNGTVDTTISQGIAVMDESTPSLDMLLEHADQALLAAKRAGKNKIRVWGEDIGG